MARILHPSYPSSERSTIFLGKLPIGSCKVRLVSLTFQNEGTVMNQAERTFLKKETLISAVNVFKLSITLFLLMAIVTTR